MENVQVKIQKGPTMYYDFELKQMVEIPQVKLEVGQRVFGELGMCFNDSGIFYVYSEPNERGIQLMVEDGGRNRFKNWEVGIDSRPISKKFGIGLYWDDSEDGKTYRKPKEELEQLYRNCKEQIEKDKEEERKEAERIAKVKEDLKQKYPFLKQNPEPKERTANVRLYLKNKFPNVKFSVRKEREDTLYVTYYDGPRIKDVAPAVKAWQDSHSDYTGDYWDYDPSPFNNLFGGFTYTFVNREFTEKTIKETEEKIKAFKDLERYDRNAIFEVAKLFDIELDSFGYTTGDCNLRCLANQVLERLDLTPAEPVAQQQVQVNADGIQIIDYSEKAIAVIGDTRSIKDTLKRLGGRFNARLSCGAGWIFSKRQEESLRNLIKE